MKVNFALLAATLFSAGVSAAEFELAAWTGIAKTNIRGTSADIQSEDAQDTSWSIDGACYLSDSLALTLGYVDQGEGVAVLEADTLTPTQYHAQVSDIAPLLTQGVTLGGAFRFWHNGAWSASLDAGIYAWDAEIESRTAGATLRSSFDGTDMYLGLSGQYSLSDNWGAGVRYRRYQLDEAINEWSLGLSYRF